MTIETALLVLVLAITAPLWGPFVFATVGIVLLSIGVIIDCLLGYGPSDRSDRSDRSDYTKRLELMVRLYRTHSEDARDALCDYLLPELNEE